MSQLGRCTCGTLLVKAIGQSTDNQNIEVYVCPKCVQPEAQKTYSAGMTKAIKIDKYGLEVLEK